MIGIDFGTMNIRMAVRKHGVVRFIVNAEGSTYTPSAVAFTKCHEKVVGEPAKRQAVTNSERTVVSVLKFIENSQSIVIDDKIYLPADIISMIFQKLKNDAEKFLHEPVNEAVVAVPAHIDISMREVIRSGAESVGINIPYMVDQYIAITEAEYIAKDTNKKIMILDFGGGSLDVTLGENQGDHVSILAMNHNSQLSCAGVDNIITGYLVDEFKRCEGVDLSSDRMAMQRLIEAAERTKMELSKSFTANINLPFITATMNGPKHFDMNLSREKLNDLIADYIYKVNQTMENVMKQAGVVWSEIDKVLLVGGGSHIVAIQDEVANIIGREPTALLNSPEECVVIGAAMKGEEMENCSFAKETTQFDDMDTPTDMESFKQKVEKLVFMKEAGLITEDEFELKKNSLMDTL